LILLIAAPPATIGQQSEAAPVFKQGVSIQVSGKIPTILDVFIFATIIVLLAIFLLAPARAADAPPANPYSGDLWTRSTLTGDWWGFRNQLAEKGVTIDMSLTQAAQGIVHGGKETGWQYGGGRGDINLSLDTQKLGFWPGGFLTVEAEGNFIPADTLRKSLNGRTGALMFVNSNQLYPTPAGDNFNLPALNLPNFSRRTSVWRSASSPQSHPLPAT
jgi:hypothetical protein